MKGIIPQGKPCCRVLNPSFPHSLDHARARQLKLPKALGNEVAGSRSRSVRQ